VDAKIAQLIAKTTASICATPMGYLLHMAQFRRLHPGHAYMSYPDHVRTCFSNKPSV
jgi:hypothetical protein